MSFFHTDELCPLNVGVLVVIKLAKAATDPLVLNLLFLKEDGRPLALSHFISKQFWLNKVIRLRYIPEIIFICCLPPVHMIVSMVTHSMTLCPDAFENFRILRYIFPNAEESCLRIISFQLLQHKWRGYRMRTVIETQVDFFFAGGEIPDTGRINSFQ